MSVAETLRERELLKRLGQLARLVEFMQSVQLAFGSAVYLAATFAAVVGLCVTATNLLLLAVAETLPALVVAITGLIVIRFHRAPVIPWTYLVQYKMNHLQQLIEEVRRVNPNSRAARKAERLLNTVGNKRNLRPPAP